ncbi:MAG: putative Ig domain-containing protein, partial [Burkholderiaceae bacterium]|nr:putative Ig domain-containing protein [Burkholderiaceae bacterium]
DTPTLVVNRPIPEVSITSGLAFNFTIPRDTFASTGGGQITFRAVLTGVQPDSTVPLPSWIRFDPATGTISGRPPEDAPAVMQIHLIARDNKGNEASVTFTIKNPKFDRDGSKNAPDKSLSKLKSDGAWIALENGDSDAELAHLDPQAATFKDVAKGRIDVTGRASLSEQIRQAHRNPASVDRLTQRLALAHRVV